MDGHGDGPGVRQEGGSIPRPPFDRPQLKALLALMRERKVRNLVIDRADRLTRQGMLAAASLLTEFTRLGILLHIVSMNMTISNEYEVMMYLQMAFAAQQANKARIEAMKRTKHKNAREGRFLRGIGHRTAFCMRRSGGCQRQRDQDRPDSRYARDRRVPCV